MSVGREKIKMYDEVFFKLIRQHSAEIGSQKEREWRKNRAYIRPAAGPGDRPVDRRAQSRASRPLSRPVCTNLHRVARSTARSTVAGNG